MFTPQNPRNDIVVSGFEFGIQELTGDWFVGFLHWDLATGGIAETPFARVTGHVGADKACAVTLIWMLAEAPDELSIQRVIGQLSETLSNNGGIRMTECAIYYSLFQVSDGQKPPPGRFLIDRTNRNEVSKIYRVRFILEEHFQAGEFDDENYRSVATIETFARAGSEGEGDVVFGTVCLTAPEWASPETAKKFIDWFFGLLSKGEGGGGKLANSADIFLVHSHYVGTARQRD